MSKHQSKLMGERRQDRRSQLGDSSRALREGDAALNSPAGVGNFRVFRDQTEAGREEKADTTVRIRSIPPGVNCFPQLFAEAKNPNQQG